MPPETRKSLHNNNKTPPKSTKHEKQQNKFSKNEQEKRYSRVDKTE